MYAIVDIETTGSHSTISGITEVAAFITDGKNIMDKYVTLVNPGVRIPGFIESLTGINEKMLQGAPAFSDIAHDLYHFLSGHIFVAHNVNFDYTFLKNNFNVSGLDFNEKKLCTVRLSRQIIPGLRSYNLDSLTRELGISVRNRHRAEDDALAALDVFHYLLANDQEQCIDRALKKGSKEAVFPPNFCKSDYERLPQKPGVYYFFDHKGKVVYVGKAKNIKQRVLSHFTGNSDLKNKQRFYNSVQHVDYELCGNELIALLFESQEIKRLWPEFNQSQKTLSRNYGIYQYEDRSGYIRFNIGKFLPLQNPIALFKSLSEARAFLQQLCLKHRLCPKMCGLQKSVGACFDYGMGLCQGACTHIEPTSDYNDRIQSAILNIGNHEGSYVILGEGRNDLESSLVMVENGRYLGFGFIDKDDAIADKDQAKNYIKIGQDNPEIQSIIQFHLRQPLYSKVIRF